MLVIILVFTCNQLTVRLMHSIYKKTRVVHDESNVIMYLLCRDVNILYKILPNDVHNNYSNTSLRTM